jgi:aminoglycoside/choline kinase family phosphotransferase
MADAWQIRGVCLPDCFWADLGTPAAYLQAHGEVLTCYRRRLPGRRLMSAEALRRMQALPRRGVRLQGFAAVGAGVVIEKNALLANAVVWDRARIAADAILEQAVVGSGAQVHGRVPRVAVRSDFSLQSEIGNADPQLAVALARLGWDPAATTAIPFEARGSARAFTRLARGRQSVIMIRYSREREENTLYAAHARFLKSIGWPVPEVLLDLPEKQFLVVEDLGDYSLQRLAEVAPARRVLHHYRQVLRLLPILHERGTRAARRRRLELVAPFAPDLYRWEREFFARQFLQPRLGLPSAEIKAILRELEGVARRLLQTPPVLIHRDLQSSNILLVGNNPFFIDFQGMRFGAAAYDLAALLCDPYVELPLARQTELLAYYNATRRAGAPVPERIFWLAAVERLAQALGAYGRLCAQPDTAWFGKYIPPALRMLRRALEQAAACRRLHTAIAAALDKMPAATDNSP